MTEHFLPLSALLKHIDTFFRTRGFTKEDAYRRSKSLLMHSFHLTSMDFVCHMEKCYDGTLVKKILEHPQIDHAPVARITGWASFAGTFFEVNTHTLEPRWETEGIIALVKNMRPNYTKVLDMGTGTGCLLISLLQEQKQACGHGIDLSPSALMQAKKNATFHGVSERTHFYCSDWLNACKEDNFDVIVCNPPYIRKDAILPRDVVDWDPGYALFSGHDGLDAYRTFVPMLMYKIAPDGVFVGEIAYDQKGAIEKLFTAHGWNATVYQDADQKDRYVVATP